MLSHKTLRILKSKRLIRKWALTRGLSPQSLYKSLQRGTGYTPHRRTYTRFWLHVDPEWVFNKANVVSASLAFMMNKGVNGEEDIRDSLLDLVYRMDLSQTDSPKAYIATAMRRKANDYLKKYETNMVFRDHNLENLP